MLVLKNLVLWFKLTQREVCVTLRMAQQGQVRAKWWRSGHREERLGLVTLVLQNRGDVPSQTMRRPSLLLREREIPSVPMIYPKHWGID